MNLSNVRAPKKSSEKRKRVGRGMGSGMGKTSTRGHTNIFRKEYSIVNLEALAALGETIITPDVLRKAGVIKTKHPVKILGDGELKAALTVHAHKFSKSAQEKIAKAGGKFEVLQ